MKIISLIKRNLIERKGMLEKEGDLPLECAHKLCYSSLKILILRPIYPREALFKFNDLLLL